MPQKHHGAAAVAVRFRTDSENLRAAAAPCGKVVRQLKKKARSDTSLSERAWPGGSGGRCCPSRFRNHRGTFMGGNVTWEIDCPNADELVQRLAAAGDQAGGSALYSAMYSPVLWAPPGWA